MENKYIYKTENEIQSLFDERKIKYIKRTRIDCEELLLMNLNEGSYYKDNKEEFAKLSSQYSNDIKCCNMAPVYIKYIDKVFGYGVFAAEDIIKEDFIGEYAGVVDIDDENECGEFNGEGDRTDYSWYYLDDLEELPNLEINGRFEGNQMRFVNHSEEPNLHVEHILLDGFWVIFFNASKNINKDDQLFISYGEGYWSEGYREMLNTNGDGVVKKSPPTAL